jgi:hypothetical protein
MTINLFGISIHEFDVVITDLLLTIEVFIFAFLLFRQKAPSVFFRRFLIALFVFFGLSSLFGAVFHAFFPLKEATLAGFVFWMLTANSILISAACVGAINTYLTGGEKRYKIAIPLILIYLFISVYHIVFVNYQFSTVIIFYSLPVIAMLVISVVQFLRGCFQKVRECRCAWVGLLIGLLLTFAAAAIQYFHVNIHPAYFNYNAFYHLIQGIAFAVMFFSFRSFLEKGIRA